VIRRRRRNDHVAGHQDRWLVSYADFITLLFAFFVTMYAISNVDAKKLSKAVTGFQVAFSEWKVAPHAGVGEGLLPGARIGTLPGRSAVAPPDGALVNVESRLFYRLRAIGEDRVEMQVDHRGLVITIKESGSFPTGSAELGNRARTILREIGLSIADVPNAVRIEGHTDDVPIHTGRYSSNWELSTARATAVIEFLVGQVGLTPSRLSAAGYAEFHPRVPNDSDEERATNRRVDIVVLNARTENMEEPSAGFAR
jgi:chemotaxis protein MotB